MVECPECAADIETSDDLEVGEILACEECGAELEVLSTDPVKIDLAPEVEEDWGE